MAKKKKKRKEQKIPGESGVGRLEKIKKLVVIAMFSDDQLMERLVLKGGNALDLIHRISKRASVDVDLSMDSDFSITERLVIAGRVEKVLKESFRPAGYEVFDVKMEEKPRG